jgi:MFS family permease
MKLLTAVLKPLTPFQHRSFSILWTTTTAALIGFWMHRVSASWLMSSMTSSPLLLSLLESFLFLPTILFSIIAGIIADYVNRARFLVIVLFIIFLVQITLVFLVGSHQVTPVILLVITFLLGTGSAFRNPALSAEFSRAVPKEELPRAIALDSISFDVARIVGPAVAGLLIASTILTIPFVISACLTLCLIMTFLFWKAAPPQQVTAASRFADIKAGFKTILVEQQFVAILLRATIFYFCGNIIWAALPIIIRTNLSLGSDTFGVMYSFFGAGAILGGILYSYLSDRVSLQTLMNLSSLGYASMLLVVSLTESVALICGFLALAGACLVTVGSSTSTVTLSIFGDELKSRSISLLYMAINGSLSVGSLALGLLAEIIGIKPMLIFAACLLSLGTFGVAMFQLRKHVAPINL